MSKYERGQMVWVKAMYDGERTAGGGYYLHVIDEGYAQTISANGRHIKPDVTFPWSPAKKAKKKAKVKK